jgi:hypothetical protein
MKWAMLVYQWIDSMEIENKLFDLLQGEFYILIYAVVILERLKRMTQRNLLASWIVNLSFTLLHEIAHYVVAFILGAKPNGFSLIPKKTTSGGKTYYQLGSVSVKNSNNFNRFPIAIAPLLLIGLLFYVNQHYYTYFEDNIYSLILYIVIVILLIDNSIPSVADIEIAFSGYGYIVWVSLLLAIAAYWNEIIEFTKRMSL